VIRTAWVYLNALVITLFYGSWVVLASVLKSRNSAWVCDNAARQWAASFIRSSGTTVRLVGVENLRRDGPQIIVSNHESWFDVFALAAFLPVRYRFVAKEELGRVPIFGRAWRTCGHVSINRGDRSSAVDSLQEAGDRVKKDALTIVMFPEGTRSETGRLESFRKGAFVLGIQTGIPIVPVAVVGSRAVMRKGSWRVRRGEIEVRIGRPIPVEGLTHRDRDALRDRAWKEIATMKGEVETIAGPGSGSRTDADGEENGPETGMDEQIITGEDGRVSHH
jgi:1-acyl-sn-glycerol-3-phosphate acyltransferase